MEASNALAIRTSDELEAAIFEGIDVEVIEDPVAVQREILRRIFAAETIGDLDETSGATPWRELLDVPIEVERVEVRRSRFQQGAAIFAVVHGYRLDEGEPVVLTTSGMNPLAKLLKAQSEGWLPWKVRMVTLAETANGYKPLDLVSAGSAKRSA